MVNPRGLRTVIARSISIGATLLRLWTEERHPPKLRERAAPSTDSACARASYNGHSGTWVPRCSR